LLSDFFFDGSVNFVGLSLGIDIGLFEISEELEGRVNGVGGLGLHVEEGCQFVSEVGLFS
jgi:hypothetical protein